MIRALILISGCFLMQYFANAQNDLPSLKETLLTEAKADKVYLQTDRFQYAIGELVYFKVFLTDENRIPKKGGVVYVELINAEKEILTKRVIKIKEGTGNGDFELPVKIEHGQHFIRAYTTFMRNEDAAFFFRKTIFVGDGADVSKTGFQNKAPLSLQFFPEGGDLVEGMKSVVAIKATNNKGKLVGQIINANKEQITAFKTDSLGFGRFELIPKPNQDYFAMITEKGKTRQWKLPKALTEGVVIRTDKQAANILQVQIDFSKNNKLLKNGHLIGHINGKVLLSERIGTIFNLGLDTLPAGIIHLTVLDELGQPRAERLVFNDHGINDYFLDFLSKKEVYSRNNPIEIGLDLFDEEGRGVSSNLLVSVCQQQYSNSNSNRGINIRDYFFFHADLPNFPLYPLTVDVEKNNADLIDLMLMTYGWRRFHWQDMLKVPKRQFTFPEENSLTISGKITKKDKPDDPIKANGLLTVLNDDFLIKTFETKKDGSFFIDSMDVYGKTDLIIQAAKKKKNEKEKLAVEGNRNVSIQLIQRSSPSFSTADSLALAKLLDNPYSIAAQNIKQSPINYKDISAEDLSIDIEEVTITGKKINKVITYYEEGMLYKRPDNRIVTENMPLLHQYNNIYDILSSQVSGMEFVRPEIEGVQKTVVFRGISTGLSGLSPVENGAKFMVNGAFVSQNYVESIPPQNIAFIDVIKSLNKLAVFGRLGVNGVIMIYLQPPVKNRPKSTTSTNGILNYQLEGYYKARTFPEIKDGKQVSSANTPYWNGAVVVDKSGEYLLNFRAPANSGIYDILVEGMSQKGMPIVGKYQIRIK